MCSHRLGWLTRPGVGEPVVASSVGNCRHRGVTKATRLVPSPRKVPKREGRKSCNQLLENYKSYLHDSRPSGLGCHHTRAWMLHASGPTRHQSRVPRTKLMSKESAQAGTSQITRHREKLPVPSGSRRAPSGFSLRSSAVSTPGHFMSARTPWTMARCVAVHNGHRASTPRDPRRPRRYRWPARWTVPPPPPHLLRRASQFVRFHMNKSDAHFAVEILGDGSYQHALRAANTCHAHFAAILGDGSYQQALRATNTCHAHNRVKRLLSHSLTHYAGTTANWDDARLTRKKKPRTKLSTKENA